MDTATAIVPKIAKVRMAFVLKAGDKKLTTLPVKPYGDPNSKVDVTIQIIKIKTFIFVILRKLFSLFFNPALHQNSETFGSISDGSIWN